MNSTIEVMGKKVAVSFTPAAVKALAQRDKKLVAEMELYFSCLIRKQVHFKEIIDDDVINVGDNFAVRFRPVMTALCGVNYEGDEPPLTDFPIKKPEAFIPRWLNIDFRKNEWLGEFGF